MYSIAVIQSHTVQSDPRYLKSQLASHVVTTILLTVFPMLYFTSLGLFCNKQLALLSPFTFSPSPPSSPSEHPEVCFLYKSVFILFLHLFCSLDSYISEIIWHFSFCAWHILLSIMPSRSILAVANS